MSSGLKQNRTLRGFAALFSKGIAMGMGDSVPGVSGGTIAVITGIYEELIGSIGRVDLTAVSLAVSGQFTKCWGHINGSFLLVLAIGILTGLLISANSVLFLLENYFEAMMGFFVGLVLASTYFLKAEFKWASWKNFITLCLGVSLVVVIAILPQQEASVGLVSVFFYGAIAICAMILPGLSGAFILLVFGIYEFMLNALVQLQFGYVLTFAGGCIVGLLAFARLLNWVLSHHRQLSYSFLSGMLIGSIATLWPWQQVALHGSANEIDAHMAATLWVSPFEYLDKTGSDPQLLATGLSFFAGAFIVFLVHRLAADSSRQKAIP